MVLLGISLAGIYAYREYTRTHADLSRVRPDVRINASSLIAEFEQDDSAANSKYLGKIIEAEGPLRAIERTGDGQFIIVLGEEDGLSSIRCSMDTTYNNELSRLSPPGSITIRGACTGFKKNELLGENLGSDVELNRGVVVSNY